MPPMRTRAHTHIHNCISLPLSSEKGDKEIHYPKHMCQNFMSTVVLFTSLTL